MPLIVELVIEQLSDTKVDEELEDKTQKEDKLMRS
jgi:hypothetical protein